MKKHEYRVICTTEKFADKIYVDIAPSDGVTHDMLFCSRKQLHEQAFGKELEDCGTHSVYLTVIANNEPEIDFSQGTDYPKGSLEYLSHLKFCERLRPQILKTYHQMKAEGKESTIEYIMSSVEAANYKYGLYKNYKSEYAQTPEAEKTRKRIEQYNERQLVSAMKNERYAQQHIDSIELMRRKMSRYSGD